MNPAPTLVNDWVTPGFTFFIAFLFVFGLLLLTAARMVKVDRLRAIPQPEPIPDRLTCDLEYCDEPSAVLFDGGLDGLLYICAKDAPKVSEWAMVVGVRGDAA